MPTELQFAIGKNMMRYIGGTEDVWLVMEIKPGHLLLKSIDAYLDADWGGIANTRKSTSCGEVFTSGFHIGGLCKTQQVVGLSSAETDTYTGTSTAPLALCVATFADEIGWCLQSRHLMDSSAGTAGIIRLGMGR